VRYVIATLVLCALVFAAGAKTAPVSTAYMPAGHKMQQVLLPPSGDPQIDAIIWTVQAPYPYTEGTYRAAASSDGRYYYISGGWIGTSGASGPRNTLHRYDPASNTWTQLANMPGTNCNHCMTYNASKNKLYVVGGYNGSALNVCWEYDIATDVWTTKAVFPVSTWGTAAVCVGDSVFAAVGDGTGFGQFYCYDINANTWAQRPNLTSGARATHGGMVELGGYLYYIDGWDACINSRYNPLTKTWETGLTPRPMPNGRSHGIGIASFAGKLYAYGGADYWSYQYNLAHIYDPLSNTWTAETPMPYTLGANSVDGRVNVHMYYTSGVYASPTNVHIRGQFPDVHNVGLAAITAPSGSVDSGAVITPQAVVRNLGTYVESNFWTYIDIEDKPRDSVFVPTLEIGALDTVDFPNSVKLEGRDSAGVTAFTYLSTETPGLRYDDTLTRKFLISVKDVAVRQITAPKDTLDEGIDVYPRCQVWNYGNTSQSFTVEFRIGAYTSNATVSNLLPGGARFVTAPDAYHTAPGTWIHRVEAILAGDLHPANNVMLDTFWVRGTPGHDVAVEEIIEPVGVYDTTETATPTARVANYGGQPETFWSWFTITDTATDRRVYRDSLQVSLGGGGVTTVSFVDTVFKVLGTHATTCSVYVAGDGNNLNDVQTGSFEVAIIGRNVAMTQMFEPAGGADSGVAVIPRCEVKNEGLDPETFNAYFQLPGGYLQGLNVADLGPDETRTLEFPEWTPQANDSLVATAWVYMPGDERPADDTITTKFLARVHDVYVEEVLEPVDTVAEGIQVYPRCNVTNHGNVGETFDVEFRIGLYCDTASVTDLAPGATQEVTMGSYITTQPGIWLDDARTLLAGDMYPGNDVKLDTFWVVGTLTHDVGVSAILAPTGTIDTMTTVTPLARVGNYGTELETWWTYFTVHDQVDAVVYSESLRSTMDPTEERTLAFPDVRFHVGGEYTARCSTFLAVDQNWTNNVATEGFEVGTPSSWPPGWKEQRPIPSLPSSRPVKRGAWLAIDDSGYIYGMKGYKTADFYKYDPIHNLWSAALAKVPADEAGKLKLPEKGCRGASDGQNYIYMTKGNNTLGFWRYDVAEDTWLRMTDVPAGPSGKRVKNGADMVYVTKDDTGYVYLMKGYKTEFYRFNTATAMWETLPNVRYVTRDKYQEGSWLCYVPYSPVNPKPSLYAHQSRYLNGTKHFMFRYDLEGDTWSKATLSGMPLYGLHGGKLKKKKAKDGSSAASFEDVIYALKGGNTQQFFKYYTSGDTWVEIDTMPQWGTTGKRKRVNQGGDFIAYGEGAFFAFKGNKTLEFWRYVIRPGEAAAQPERSGVMGHRSTTVPSKFALFPNPMAGGFATVSYSLPKAGPLSVTVFDVAGRSVHRQVLVGSRTGAASIDLRKLANGVYLVRLDADGYSSNQKLVVQR